VDCNRPELLKKLRYKVQEKQIKLQERQNKKFCPSPRHFVDSKQNVSSKCRMESNEVFYSESSPSPQQTDVFQTSPYSTGSIDPFNCYIQQSPLTPPYSDDGNSVDCSAVYSSSTSILEHNAAAYSPPYSPPNGFSRLDEALLPNLDEPSLFEGTYPTAGSNAYGLAGFMQKANQQLLVDELPELDRGAVEMFFQIEESKDFDLHPTIIDSNFASEKNAQVPTGFTWAYDQTEFVQPGLMEVGEKSDFMDASQSIEYNYLRPNELNFSNKEGSFIDLIESSLFFEAIDSLSSAGRLFHA
jgi:hypothetical protein